MQEIRIWAGACIVILVALAMAGCGGGPTLGEVTGTVAVNGTPAGDLMVVFEPPEDTGGTSIGVTKPDGTYQLHYPGGETGAVLGTHTVRVSVEERDEEEEKPASPSLQLPAKYNVESELKFQVKSGANTFDIQIVTE